jgi:hypothetical protein
MCGTDTVSPSTHVIPSPKPTPDAARHPMVVTSGQHHASLPHLVPSNRNIRVTKPLLCAVFGAACLGRHHDELCVEQKGSLLDQCPVVEGMHPGVGGAGQQRLQDVTDGLENLPG